MTSRYLITGALGCIGAWTIKQLAEEGHKVVAADLGTDRSRLRLVSGGPDLEQDVVFAQVDVTDQQALGSLVVDEQIERVIHYAALQVPASHANPPAGASVNVVGTSNVLEIARREGLENVVFASSVAVYGPELAESTDSIGDEAQQNPNNFYGVFKRADEAVAELYFQHHGVASIGLRPHTVYGPGRDTGLTAAPTWAMFAASRGMDMEVPFAGSVGLQYAPDVAQAFIRASAATGDGRTRSIRGSVTAIGEFADMLNRREGSSRITVTGEQLPFPAALDESGLVELIGEVPTTPLAHGIEATIEHFAEANPGDLPNPPS